jgi:hypothetical protein
MLCPTQVEGVAFALGSELGARIAEHPIQHPEKVFWQVKELSAAAACRQHLAFFDN